MSNTTKDFEDMWMSAWHVGDMLYKLKIISRSEQMKYENYIGQFIMARKSF